MSKPCRQSVPHTEGSLHDHSVHKCRCKGCREAYSAYQRNYRKRRASGQPSKVNGQLVRSMLQQWLSESSYRSIANRSGVPVSTLHRIVNSDGPILWTTHQRVAVAFSERPKITE